METIGPYRLLLPPSGEDRAPTQVVFDTNVAIDIERMYFQGPGSVTPHLRELLLRFPAASRSFGRETEVIWGFGAAEAYWKRGRGPDPLIRRRIAHACQEVVGWSAERITKEFSNRYAPANRDKSWPSAIPPGSELSDPRRFIAIQYGAGLRLLDLDRNRAKWRAKGVVTVLREFDEWMRDHLGARSAYMFFAALDLLAGSPDRANQARGLFKISGNESAEELAQKAWNSAWDFFLLTLPEGFTFGSLPVGGPSLTTFVSKDKDPYQVRLRATARMFVDHGRGPNPYIFGTLETRPSVPIEELSQLITTDVLSDMHRAQRDPEQVLRQVATTVHELEAELGVSLRLSHDGWYLD